MVAGRADVVVEDVRKLINTHQYNNEPFRILLASLSSGLYNTDAFLASTLTKHLLREVRGIDTAVKNPESLKWNKISIASASYPTIRFRQQIGYS